MRNAQIAKDWLESDSNAELDLLTLRGLQVNVPEKGLIRCNFIVPHHLSDRDGNWHIGAMATMIDNIAANTVFSLLGKLLAAISINITSYSTAKIHDEIEIEGKVVGERGSLLSVVVNIKKKTSGDKIALGKLWMGPAMPKGSSPKDFSPKASLPSKL